MEYIIFFRITKNHRNWFVCTFSLAPALFSYVCYIHLSWLFVIFSFFSVVFYIPSREAAEMLFTSVGARWHGYGHRFTAALSWVTCSRKVILRNEVFQWPSSFSSWHRRRKCINSGDRKEKAVWAMGRFHTPKWRYPDKGSKCLAKWSCPCLVPWFNDIWGLRVNPAH